MRQELWELSPWFLLLASFFATLFSVMIWDGPTTDPTHAQLSVRVGEKAFTVFVFVAAAMVIRCVYRHLARRWQDTAITHSIL